MTGYCLAYKTIWKIYSILKTVVKGEFMLVLSFALWYDGEDVKKDGGGEGWESKNTTRLKKK